MIIGNYIYSTVEQTAGYSYCFVKPNFVPRKVDRSASGTVPAATGDSDESRTKPSVETLSAEQKASLKNRLNNGQGDLSLQEWDDFLADLEEYGIISHDERFVANGTLRDIPEGALHGGTHFSNGNTSNEIAQMWKGEPLTWLDDMDVYTLKNQLYASMGSRYMHEPGGQREVFHKVAQITRAILA